MLLQAVMYMEWRPEYEIVVTPAADSFSSPEVEISAPLLSFQRWGIYNHLATEWAEGRTVLRVVPRFLFGIPVQTVTQMYSGPTTADLLSNLPIIGVFTQSTRYDRVIIQVSQFYCLFFKSALDSLCSIDRFQINHSYVDIKHL